MPQKRKQTNANAKYKLALCMIVKDEAHIISETLNNVLPFIDYWVICDTGSTDNTKELIKDFFKKADIPGELHDIPWKNFGWCRTQAFNFAFKKAQYLWVIDADDIIVTKPNSFNFDKIYDVKADSYMLKYGNNSFVYWRQQIFNGYLRWVYRCAVHEYAACLSKKDQNIVKIEGDYYVDSRRLGSRTKNVDQKTKYLRDAHMLEEEINTEKCIEILRRDWFYLGQSYFDAFEYEKAIKAYEKRITFDDQHNEEIYYSLYKIGFSLMKLNRPIDEIEQAVIKADKKCPERIEAFYEFAKYCQENNKFELGKKYAKLAVKKVFPQHHSLFVNKGAYDFNAWDVLAICYHYTGKPKKSIKLYLKLLKENKVPEHDKPRINNNIVSTLQTLSYLI